MKKHTILDTLQIVAESDGPIDNHGIIMKTCTIHPHLKKHALKLQRNINNHLKTLCEAGILLRHATESNKLRYTSRLKTDALLKQSNQNRRNTLTPFFLSLSEKLLESNLPEQTFEMMKSAFFDGALINFDEREQKRKKSFDEMIYILELKNKELKNTAPREMTKTIATVEMAYQDEKAIEFEYESANEGITQKKRIGIEGMVIYFGQPYVLGNDYDQLTPYYDSRRIKPYKLIRIRNPRLIEESNYERTWIDSIQKYYEGSLGLWRNEGNIIHGIELRVATRILPFITEILPCKVSILNRGPSFTNIQLDGIRVNRDLYRFLLQWGADLKVIKPQPLASNLEKYRKTSIVNEEKKARLKSTNVRMDHQTELLIQLAKELRDLSGNIIENLIKSVGSKLFWESVRDESARQTEIGILRWNYVQHQKLTNRRRMDLRIGEQNKRIKRLSDLELYLNNNSNSLEIKLDNEAKITTHKVNSDHIKNIRYEPLNSILNHLKINRKIAPSVNLHLNELNSFFSYAFDTLGMRKNSSHLSEFTQIVLSDMDCESSKEVQICFVKNLKQTLFNRQ